MLVSFGKPQRNFENSTCSPVPQSANANATVQAVTVGAPPPVLVTPPVPLEGLTGESRFAFNPSDPYAKELGWWGQSPVRSIPRTSQAPRGCPASAWRGRAFPVSTLPGPVPGPVAWSPATPLAVTLATPLALATPRPPATHAPRGTRRGGTAVLAVFGPFSRPSIFSSA